MCEIQQWNDIKNDYSSTLIIGNGGSIAVDKRFSYDSLYEEAFNNELIDKKLKSIFKTFNSSDFEAILHILLQAEIVNKALAINNEKIKSSYINCRTALINTIQKIHPTFDEINKEQLINIAVFMKQFKTVISLNYDLLLYWVIYVGNQDVLSKDGDVLRKGQRFKDCFTESAISNGKVFSDDYSFLRQKHCSRRGATLIFYLHGNLTLANFITNSCIEQEVKLTSKDDTHLDTIYEKWKTEKYSPLFICEGDYKRKLDSIKQSSYLTTVYNKVFEDIQENITIYGWKMSDQDQHIIDRINEINRKNPIKKIAVSVYTKDNAENFIQRIKEIIKSQIGGNIHIDFYDSNSESCWINK